MSFSPHDRAAVTAAFARIDNSRLNHAARNFKRRHLQHSIDSAKTTERLSIPVKICVIVVSLPIDILFLLWTVLEFVQISLADLVTDAIVYLKLKEQPTAEAERDGPERQDEDGDEGPDERMGHEHAR